MFRDHSLVPAEAIRLAALGFLAEAPRRYADLAGEIRHLTSRIVGPSPELMGTSLELLRYEGLAEAIGGESMRDNPELRITTAGRQALAVLLRAGLRGPVSDLAKLGLALKLRFLHHLPETEQTEQIAQVKGAWEAEIARLEDLRAHDPKAPPLYRAWLDHDIAQMKARLAWLEAQRQAKTP